jgi:hypothetical protein
VGKKKKKKGKQKPSTEYILAVAALRILIAAVKTTAPVLSETCMVLAEVESYPVSVIYWRGDACFEQCNKDRGQCARHGLNHQNSKRYN